VGDPGQYDRLVLNLIRSAGKARREAGFRETFRAILRKTFLKTSFNELGENPKEVLQKGKGF
jgi:hypothetical protein